MTDLLLAEDLALLLLDDNSGWLRNSYADYALAGALATELALRGRIRLSEKGERNVRRGRVIVCDTTPTDDALLDEALARLAPRPVRFRNTTLMILRKNVKQNILQRLVERGLVEARDHRVLGLVPVTVHPMVQPEHEQRLRAGLFAVLVQGEEPTVRQACLIALLGSLNMAGRVMLDDVSTVNRRAIRRRSRQLTKSHWAAEATARMIQQSQSATSG